MTKERTCILLYLLVSVSVSYCYYMCPADFIKRKSMNKYICCRKLLENCKPGYYVHTCTKDWTSDECRKCPDETWLWDPTNSTITASCVEYSCSLGSKKVDYMPKKGCQRPCICDNDRGFYGDDSCNCQVIPDRCKPYESFSSECPELKKYDTRINDFKRRNQQKSMTTSNMTNGITTYESRINYNTTTQKTGIDGTPSKLSSTSVEIRIIFVVIGLVISLTVVGIGFLVVPKYRKYRKRHIKKPQGERDVEDQTEVKRLEDPDKSLTDDPGSRRSKDSECEPFIYTNGRQVGYATPFPIHEDLKFPEQVSNRDDKTQCPTIVTSGTRFGREI